jgi:putative methyltransferase (TIGR04325 family)
MKASLLKSSLTNLIPPIFLKLIRRTNKYGFFGDYTSWETAKKNADGYDSSVILTKVKNSLLKVKQGEAVYERDSIIFDKVQYSYPVLAALFLIACENNNQLNILDFGGSLGSHYFQYKNLLSSLSLIKWNIVEQQKFVLCGKEFFENNQLRFYLDISSCIQDQNPSAVLLSSVVQYLELPFQFLEYLIYQDFKYIIFDRTSFIKQGDNRLTIQKVSPDIYSASYPAWFLNLDNFLKLFSEKYNLISEFDALAGIIDVYKPYAAGIDKGFIFKRKF